MTCKTCVYWNSISLKDYYGNHAVPTGIGSCCQLHVIEGRHIREEVRPGGAALVTEDGHGYNALATHADFGCTNHKGIGVH